MSSECLYFEEAGWRVEAGCVFLTGRAEKQPHYYNYQIMVCEALINCGTEPKAAEWPLGTGIAGG